MSVREPDDPRAALEARWLVLTRTTLPELAAARQWPVSRDHCFQRILLDAACGGRWYDHIAGRPAFRAASIAQLDAAVRLADDVVSSAVDLWQLNTQSLRWRGKI